MKSKAAASWMALVQGRGYASTAEVSMIDAREEECCVVRPMLAVPRKELVLHCYFSSLPFLSNSMPASIKASITSQTEEFISDLYVRFHSTACWSDMPQHDGTPGPVPRPRSPAPLKPTRRRPCYSPCCRPTFREFCCVLCAELME